MKYKLDKVQVFLHTEMQKGTYRGSMKGTGAVFGTLLVEHRSNDTETYGLRYRTDETVAARR